jgi:L-seryl-tRNA(Ser) seleniumtransferase
MTMKASRRQFIAGLGASAPLGYLATADTAEAQAADTPDYFGSLGVRPFINAIGPYSSLGGAVMWPEVVEAMDYAIRHKVRMTDLHDAVGKRIAELTGAPSAMVTAGATCAIILGTAACMTMGDEALMEQLPNGSGMPSDVVILKSQRYLYDRSIKAPGASLVEVETAADIRAAVSENTAMFFYLANRPEDVKIDVDEYVALAKEFDIPIMCDAATTVPPVGRIPQTVGQGFDLVCYSGGKGLRGPYSAGLLLGREDLVRFARMNGSPNHRAFGRSMKVAPEEYLGMMVAVEKSMAFDEEAEYRRQLATVNLMGDRIAALAGVNAETHDPVGEAREPYTEIRWDADRYPISVADVKQALRDGDPSVEVRALFLSDGQLHLTATMLRPGEPEIVAARVIDILEGSAA